MLKAALLASLVIATGSAPTLAQAQREPSKTVVEARGFDFSNPADVKTVHDMLWRAAVSVCDSRIELQLGDEMSDHKCAVQSMDRAVAGLHQPMLTAYHQGHSIKSNETKFAGPSAEPGRQSPGGR
jgi:UrcA family protein